MRDVFPPLLLTAAVFLFPPSVCAGQIAVTVSSAGDNTSHITLATDIKAAQSSLWALLTDFNHQAEFLPYISKSQIVGKMEGDILVDQAGTIQILFWTFTMRMKQRVSEDPPTRMHFNVVEGDFYRLEGDFALSALGANAGTHLACDFIVKPKRRVPDWAVRMAAKHYLLKMVHVLSEKAEKQNP